MIPAHLVEQLSTALPRRNGRATDGDTPEAGESLASAATDVLV